MKYFIKMVFNFFLNNCKITIDIYHIYNPKTDKHRFQFESIHIDDIFYDDIDLALNILDLDAVTFSNIVIEQFFKNN